MRLHHQFRCIFDRVISTQQKEEDSGTNEWGFFFELSPFRFCLSMQIPDVSLKTKKPCFYLRTPLLRRRTAVVIVSGRDARAQRTKGSKESEKGVGVSCAVVTKITV